MFFLFYKLDNTSEVNILYMAKWKLQTSFVKKHTFFYKNKKL